MRYAWTDPVLVRVNIAVIKQNDQNNLERKGFNCLSYVCIHHWRIWGQEFTLMQRLWVAWIGDRQIINHSICGLQWCTIIANSQVKKSERQGLFFTPGFRGLSPCSADPTVFWPVRRQSISTEGISRLELHISVSDKKQQRTAALLVELSLPHWLHQAPVRRSSSHSEQGSICGFSDHNCL